MESRGHQNQKPERQRPPISRRSCDHCRARKIGCDRKTPCSNCVSARLECVHSAVASSTQTSRQRVLLSEQYEKKIDSIVRDLADIKQLLQRPPEASRSSLTSLGSSDDQLFPQNRIKDLHRQVNAGFKPDSAAHIVDFIKCVTDFPDPTRLDADSQALVLSLRRTAKGLQSPALMDIEFGPVHARPDNGAGMSIPPQETAVSVLRWARENQRHPRISWLFDILPLRRFSDICQKVYFALDDYGDFDVILANGCLHHIFAAHAHITAATENKEHQGTCQRNIHEATIRLPLISPATVDTIAALVLSAINATETDRLEVASTLILNAANLCQRLGFDRLQHSEAHEDSSLVQRRLFVTVCNLEHALSLRTGRTPTLSSECQMSPGAQTGRLDRLSTLHAQVKAAVMAGSRGGFLDISKLIRKLRGLSQETRQNLTTETGFVHLFCLQTEILVQSSLLGLILETQISTSDSSLSTQDSGAAVPVARNIMGAYCQFLTCLGTCPAIPKASHNWFIHNTPFIAFKVVFSSAVQTFNIEDIHQLESFALSVDVLIRSDEVNPQPSVYQLLCKAVRFTAQGDASARGTQKALFDSSAHLPLPNLQDGNADTVEKGALAPLTDDILLLRDQDVMDLGSWWTLEDDMDLATPDITDLAGHAS